MILRESPHRTAHRVRGSKPQSKPKALVGSSAIIINIDNRDQSFITFYQVFVWRPYCLGVSERLDPRTQCAVLWVSWVTAAYAFSQSMLSDAHVLPPEKWFDQALRMTKRGWVTSTSLHWYLLLSLANTRAYFTQIRNPFVTGYCRSDTHPHLDAQQPLRYVPFLTGQNKDSAILVYV